MFIRGTLFTHRPVSIESPDNSWYNDDGTLEVETGFCNYLHNHGYNTWTLLQLDVER